jgi:hypothetical protein
MQNAKIDKEKRWVVEEDGDLVKLPPMLKSADADGENDG